MAFEISYTNQFFRDVKKVKKRNPKDILLLENFILLLQEDGVKNIPSKNKPHKLIGDYKGTWEAHIKPDLLIIWFQVDEDQKIILSRCGTHSDLF